MGRLPFDPGKMRTRKVLMLSHVRASRCQLGLM